MWLKTFAHMLFLYLQLFSVITAQNKFSIGDKVKSNATLNVRSGAATTYSILFQAYNGETGAVTGGPSSGSGYFWYKVRWDKNSQEGWSVQDGLDKAGAKPGSFILSGNAYCNTIPPVAPAILLSWGKSSGATSYDIYRNGSLYYSNLTGTSFDNNTNVIAVQSYSYYIIAKNNYGTTQSNTINVSVPSNICGSKPGDFSLTATTQCNGSQSEIKLEWTASQGATSYLLYRNGVHYTTLTTTYFTNTGPNVVSGTTYSYQVFATNQYGQTTSNIVTKTAPSCSVSLPDLTISSNNVASTYSSGQKNAQINVTVNRSGGNLKNGIYVLARLYFSTDNSWDSGDTQLWGSNGSTPDFPNDYLNSNGTKTVVATFDIPNVNPSIYYIIAVADPTNYHPESNENNNTNVYSVNIISNKPGAFTLSAITQCNDSQPEVKLSWTQSQGASAYDVYRDGSLYYAELNASTTIFLNTGINVSSNKTYSYYIQAKNSSGTTNSNSVSITTLNCSDNPPVVTSFSINPTSDTIGSIFTLSYVITDDVGLSRVELWRTTDLNNSPNGNDWNQIKTTKLSGQKSYSSSFTDSLTSPAIFWYGIHVVDTKGTVAYEPDPPGPLKGTVTPNLPTINSPGDVSSPGPVLTTLTPQFTWNEVTGATGYGLYIRDMTTNTLVYPNSSGLTSTPLIGTSYNLPSEYLVNGHTYRWAMTSFIGSTETLRSSYRYFRIQITSDGHFTLGCPIPNRTPYTAIINSVFDHSMSSPYTSDQIVVAYNGEKGEAKNGADYVTTIINGQQLYGFKNSAGTNFIINGNYSGGGAPSYLYYDGHPGIDFKTTDQNSNGRINVLAAASGVAHIVNGSSYNTIYIDHENGYSTYYLHLSQRLITEGALVNKGDIIGISGDTGSPGSPHLHFEVRKNGVEVDPYGWLGTGQDSYTREVNVNLWESGNSSNSLYVDFTSSSISGNVPLAVNFQIDVGGSATGTINYSLWWNCNNSGANVSEVINSCGNPNNSTVGVKYENTNETSKTISHTFSMQGIYNVKLIVERATAVPVTKTIQINVSSAGIFAYDSYLSEASSTYDIPFNLLKAIAMVESGIEQSAINLRDGGCGVMQLTGTTKTVVAQLLQVNENKLCENSPEGARLNILGGAAVLRDYVCWASPRVYSKTDFDRCYQDILPYALNGDENDKLKNTLEVWWWPICRYNGGGQDDLINTSNYPFRVWKKLNELLNGNISYPPNSYTKYLCNNELTPEGNPVGFSLSEISSGDDLLFPAPNDLGNVASNCIRYVKADFNPFQEIVLHNNDGTIYGTQSDPIPLITVSDPVDKQVLTTPQITVQGTTTDQSPGQISLVEVKLNSGNWEIATGTTSWSKEITLKEGNNIIVARAKDNANQYSTEASIIVTYVPPNEPCVTITLPTIEANSGSTIKIPIDVDDISGKNIISYSFKVTYNSDVVSIESPYIEPQGTLSEGWQVLSNTDVTGEIVVAGIGTTTLGGGGELVKLVFKIIGKAGETTSLTCSSFVFNNGSPCASISNGMIDIPDCVCGDANNDGNSGAYDAALTLRCSVGLENNCNDCADVDGNGVLSAFDAANILMHSIGLPSVAQTCFDDIGLAKNQGDVIDFNITTSEVSQKQTSTELILSINNIQPAHDIYSMEFEIEFNESGSILTIDTLPGEYLSSINKLTETRYKVGIINAEGIKSKDIILHVSLDKENTNGIVVKSIKINGKEKDDIFIKNPQNDVQISDYSLTGAYPNPFNPFTNILFTIPITSKVNIVVYDILGREITTLVNEEKLPGNYEVKFDGSNLASGVYFYRLQAGSFSDAKKFILLK